jgi:hypothetical protein
LVRERARIVAFAGGGAAGGAVQEDGWQEF